MVQTEKIQEGAVHRLHKYMRDFSKLKQVLNETAEMTEKKLMDILKEITGRAADNEPLADAVRYSLLSGGKRIRPFLTVEVSRMFGGDPTTALLFGCAVEMIHTYSLIHDDLPCMDNDDIRRGKPTNHKVFGEAVALLAGDALLTEAFSVLTSASIPADISQKAVAALAAGAGMNGMILGQMLDMCGETQKIPFEVLIRMHRKKTGALISTAALLGCYAAGIIDSTDPRSASICKYAENVGLAFQIIDDRLDVLGNDELLGKATGSDFAQNKTTFMSFMDEKEAYGFAKRLTDEAAASLEQLPQHEILTDLAYYLLIRDK